MANTALTASIIAREALVMLENQLGILNTLYRAHEDEFAKSVNGYRVGDSISIRRPADFTVRTGATASIQDVIEGSVTLQVSQQVGVDFQFTSTELTMKIEDLSERVIRPAMSTIVNEIARDCFSQFYQAVYEWVGTPGQTVDAFSDFAKAPERLDIMAVPQDNRQAGMHPTDYWGLIGAQTSLFVQDIARPAFREGAMGNVAGLDTYMSQVLPTHTVTAATAMNIPSGAVSYDTAKNTWTQTVAATGITGATATLNAGDVFTLPNTFKVNPKTKVSTGVLQQFVITTSVTASGGNATVTFAPPMITSGPHQTVTASTGGAATFVGTASTAYRQNLAYHKNAFALAVVPMDLPPGAYGAARDTYKGFSARVIPFYDGTNDISKWRLDILYGRRTIDPRLAVRFSGS